MLLKSRRLGYNGCDNCNSQMHIRPRNAPWKVPRMKQEWVDLGVDREYENIEKGPGIAPRTFAKQ